MTQPIVDARPQGEWCVTRRRVRPHVTSDLEEFYIIAVCEQSRVDGYVAVGSFGGYSPSDWHAEGVDEADAWYLGQLTPGSPVHRGGTTAVLDTLAQLADRECKWVFTEVKCRDERLNPLVRHLLARVGFESRDPDPTYADMMVREPR